MKKNGLLFIFSLIIMLSGFLFSVKANESAQSHSIQLTKAEGPDLTISSYRTMDGQEVHNFGTITVLQGGNLRFLDTYGNVTLNCQKLVVAGGVVTIDATSGIYINCGEIEVLAGSVFAPASGLNLSCRGITNYGQIFFGTSNNITVNGDIINGAGITYRGNGFVFSGDKIVQTNDTAQFRVSSISNSVTDRPLYLGGNIQFKNTAFNIGGRVVKNLNSNPVQLNFDGGYLILADGSMDSINIAGKNYFYISDGLYTHSQWTGEIQLSGWNTNIGDGSVVDATVVPKDYHLVSSNIYLEADNYLYTSGNAIIRGEIKDTLRLKITMRVYNSLSNFGTISTLMNVYGGGDLKNYGKIINDINLYEDNLYLNLPLGNKTLINSGEIRGKVYFNTDYQVNSGTGSGFWEGVVLSYNQLKKSTFSGKHSFSHSTVSHLIFDKNAELTAINSQFTYLNGNNTFIKQKSVNEYQEVKGFDIYGAGKMTFLGNNTCNIIALDTLCFKRYQSGWDVQYPTINGKIESSGPALWNGTFDLYTVNGEWINNGSILNQGYVNGTLVNNGTVRAQLQVNGNVFSNGKWTNEYDKPLYMKFIQGKKHLWMVNNSLIDTRVNFSPYENTTSKTWYKNGIPDNTVYDSYASISQADTALYQAKSNANVWSGTLQVSVKNPFQFIAPAHKSDTIQQQVSFQWNRIPGATAYKVRLNYISDKNNQEYGFYTDTVATDTVLTVSGMGQFIYKAYLSVRFGFDGNYTWSQESYPFIFQNGQYAAVNTEKMPEFRVYPSAVKSGEMLTLSGLQAGYIRVVCTDLSGRIISKLYDGESEGELRLKTSEIQNGGMYLINVSQNEKQSVAQLLVY
jgi:hypothetical protein